MNDSIDNLQRDIDVKINTYVQKTRELRMNFQNKLFSIFIETTGWRPQDICVVEKRLKTDNPVEEVTLFYFDLKHRYEQENCNSSVAKPHNPT